MGASRRCAAAAAAVVVLLLATGCTEDAATEDKSGLTASASRTRDDDNAGGQFQTRVSNTSASVVTVRSVSLDSPGFEPADKTPRDIELRPGSRIDIPTKYGSALCGSDPTPAYANIEVVQGDSTATERILLDTPYDVLGTIHREQCTADEVAAAVRLGLKPMDQGGPVLPATLTVERLTSIDDIRVDEIRGSVLYTLIGDVPATLLAGQHSLGIPLTIEAATCAAHSIADSKKPFVFPVFIAFGDGDPVYARIPVTIDVQQTLIAYQSRVCRDQP